MQLNEFSKYFGGSTDLFYLELHYSRFLATRKLAYESWKWERADILDIGAHWLHQSVLYALDGHRVTAADLAITLDYPAVRSTASNHGIELLVLEDLSSERVFDDLDDDSMDVVLFCEILEHITFNPVAMWKAIYRVLRPAGRVIITTPNFYALRSLTAQATRFLSGRGSGISVSDILNVPTHAPHWKEYSRKELKQYFESLSPDFSLSRSRYISYGFDATHLNWKGRLVRALREPIPLLRAGIYAEVDLLRKNAGIGIEPDWERGP